MIHISKQLFATRIAALAAVVFALFLPMTSGAERLSLPEPRHYAISPVGNDIGLATVEAIVMVQDPSGFLWIGTPDGLMRYDGVGIKLFGTDDGLPDPWVTDLGVAPNGTLWAATDNGVAHFDGSR